jgi:hypothetical protein
MRACMASRARRRSHRRRADPSETPPNTRTSNRAWLWDQRHGMAGTDEWMRDAMNKRHMWAKP